MVNGFIIYIVENIYFGWNAVASGPWEKFWDGTASIMIMTGFLLFFITLVIDEWKKDRATSYLVTFETDRDDNGRFMKNVTMFIGVSQQEIFEAAINHSLKKSEEDHKKWAVIDMRRV